MKARFCVADSAFYFFVIVISYYYLIFCFLIFVKKYNRKLNIDKKFCLNKDYYSLMLKITYLDVKHLIIESDIIAIFI